MGFVKITDERYPFQPDEIRTHTGFDKPFDKLRINSTGMGESSSTGRPNQPDAEAPSSSP